MFKFVPIPGSGGMFSLVNQNGEFVKGGTRKDLKLFIEQTNSKPKEFKGTFHCVSHCTECCQQLIDVSESELFRIKRALRKLSEEDIHRIKNQIRDKDTCPLLDVDKGVCSVYESRPSICKAFGCYTGALACSYNLDVKLEPVQDYFWGMFHEPSPRAGKLGVDFTWERGLLRNR